MTVRNNDEQRITSSEDSFFDDIRPCKDEEVALEIKKIIEDKKLVNDIVRYRYKWLGRSFAFILRPLVKRYMQQKFGKVTNVAQFQELVARFMQNMIESSTDGVEFIGFDKLDKNKGYLFISNHRDISLDPAFVDYALYLNGMDTVRIAIGDNLLKTKAASSLMRINKSFIVKRNISSMREKLKELTKLSTYIGLSLKEKHSIWIAQKEGRAKDGNDKTDVAVLKMFYVYGKKNNLSFKEYIKTMNLVPVSITYEYDPGDLAKAKELVMKKNTGKYQKGELEDLISIASGIKGYKGRVCLIAGDPIYDGFETPEELAALIDKFIYENYQMYPSTLLACGIDNNCTSEQKRVFNERIASYPQAYRQQVLDMYAMPYKNLCKLKEQEK